MLSAIVLASDATMPPARPDAVVRTLAALVPAAIEGLVRDVTLAGLSGGELAHIADHAGCALSESADPEDVLREAFALARGSRLFILRAGRALETGFVEELMDLMAAREASERGALLRDAPETFIARAFPRFAPAAGLVAPRQHLQGLKATSLVALVRGTPRAVNSGARAPRGLNASIARQLLAWPRFRCSSSRGMISTKLQGRCL